MIEQVKPLASLLLLHAKDAENISEELVHQLKYVPTQAVCVDDPDFSLHPSLEAPTNLELQIVFFSPGFLDFLERRPEEAFVALRHMNPQLTIAAFCNGLSENEIMCYHMAPLNSYSSWPKYEISVSPNGDGVIAPQLLQTLEGVFSLGEKTGSIVIVPDMIQKDINTVYGIFTTPIHEIGYLSVYLEGQKIYQVTPDNVNPYVMKISIPDLMMETCRTINVKIQRADQILTEKKLFIVQNRSSIISLPHKRSLKKSKTSREEILLDEQLQFMSDFTNTSSKPIEEEYVSQDHFLYSPEHDLVTRERSLTALCKKYGLEELSFFISEHESSKGNLDVDFGNDFSLHEPLQKRESGKSRCRDRNSCILSNNSSLHVEDDDFGVMKRPVSLPSLLTTQEECNPSYDVYLRMGPIEKKPGTATEDILEEDDMSRSMSNNGYVCMKWNRNDELHRGLSESQQELLDIMLSFKYGQMTLSDVEEQFQVWKRRHYRPSRLFREDDAKLQNSSWKTLIQKKSKRKLSKDDGFNEGRTRFVSDSSNPPDSRKTSNASQTSFSSKTSDISTSTVNSRGFERRHKESVSTGWIPAYSTSTMCPLHPEATPPPLPPRPPMLLKSKEKTTEDSSLPTLSRRKSSRELVRSISRSQNDLDQINDNERVRTLVEFCEKNGLEDIRGYFLHDLTISPNGNKDENMDFMKDDGNVLDSKKYLHVNEWDNEHSSGVLHRSLSLPSSLGSAENKETGDKDGQTGEFHCCEQSSNCKCDDCLLTWNSLTSNIYISVNSKMDIEENQALLKTELSGSQQELLDFIHAFKKGQKTIAEVEQNMREWNSRHIGDSSHRERELLLLKHEYERVQKSNTFGLQDIKNFILGKPKKKDSKAGLSSTAKRLSNPKGGKSESDGKRLSKISFTSTSSGISDSSEVFPVSFFNPGYGRYQGKSMDASSLVKPTSSSPKLKPPPLPHSAMGKKLTRQNSISGDHEDNEVGGSEECTSPKSPSEKPSPPPKPTNLFKEGSSTFSDPKEEVDGTSETRPDSPDYITPNEARLYRAQYRKKLMASKGQNNLAPPKVRVTGKEEPCLALQCPAISPSATKPSKYDKSIHQKRVFFKLANPLMKTGKRKDESMFYVASKKWTSFPDLRKSNQPIYVEFLGPPEQRSKSIADNDEDPDNKWENKDDKEIKEEKE